MVVPVMEVAKTQWLPARTLRITTWPADRLERMLLLLIFPMYLMPRELTEAQTKRSPLTYPPFPLSQVLRVLGVCDLPTPVSAMATELMRHPALQMVLDEVPSCQLPHLASHCLQRGQLLAIAKATSTANKMTLDCIGSLFLLDIQSVQQPVSISCFMFHCRVIMNMYQRLLIGYSMLL